VENWRTGVNHNLQALYSKLFEWIAKLVNDQVSVLPSGTTDRSIGILDIFGFESFEENSFEQMLINFTNEKVKELCFLFV
jgi:myosin heavy subunit